MISFNQITLVGNVGSDPETRATKDGTPVTNFPLAVNTYAGKDKNEAPMWVTVVAWKNLASQAEKLIAKGRLVLVSGRLSLRKYKDKNEVERTAVEVIANTIQMLDSKGKAIVADQAA